MINATLSSYVQKRTLTLHQRAIQVQAVVYMLSLAPWFGQILSHKLVDQVYQQGRADSLRIW